MKCDWIVVGPQRICYAAKDARCHTRPGCDRQNPRQRQLLYLLPPNEAGSDDKFVNPTAQINDILDGIVDGSVPPRELAFVIVEDDAGDARIALSWISVVDVQIPSQ